MTPKGDAGVIGAELSFGAEGEVIVDLKRPDALIERVRGLDVCANALLPQLVPERSKQSKHVSTIEFAPQLDRCTSSNVVPLTSIQIKCDRS